MNKLFIAPKIKIGYQSRNDTFNGKLAYIIYFDEKGKLHKEKSWESWRNKSIPADEYENVPIDGFTINKDIKRYNGEWFSSKRTMVRIHDPRGFEFEVTTENLIAILMHTDCSRRSLIGQFVYAWAGQELVLLPTNSEEYQNAIKYTAGLNKKVSIKELIPGMVYKTKRREKDVTYIGRFNYYDFANSGYRSVHGPRKEKKSHIFTYDNGETFFRKDSSAFLSEKISDTIVSNYAELVEKYNSRIYANKIVAYEIKKVDFNSKLSDKNTYYAQLKRDGYFIKDENKNIVYPASVASVPEYDHKQQKYVCKGYKLNSGYDHWNGTRIHINLDNAEIESIKDPNFDPQRRWNNSHDYSKIHTEESMNKLDLYDLYVIFENGKSFRVDSLDELSEYSTIKLIINN
jgi:hypothetical protein